MGALFPFLGASAKPNIKQQRHHAGCFLSKLRYYLHELEQKNPVPAAGRCSLMDCDACLRLCPRDAIQREVRLLQRYVTSGHDARHQHAFFLLPDPRDSPRRHSLCTVFPRPLPAADARPLHQQSGLVRHAQERMARYARSPAAEVPSWRHLRPPNLKLLPSQAEPRPSCAPALFCAARSLEWPACCVSVGGSNESPCLFHLSCCVRSIRRCLPSADSCWP